MGWHSQQANKPSAENSYTAEVSETSKGKNSASSIVFLVAPRVWIMEVIVRFLVLYVENCAPKNRINGKRELQQVMRGWCKATQNRANLV